jgi:hypothetical protein
MEGQPSTPPPPHLLRSACSKLADNTARVREIATRRAELQQMRLFKPIFQNPKPLYTSLNPLCSASHPQLLAAAQAPDARRERIVNGGVELFEVLIEDARGGRPGMLCGC